MKKILIYAFQITLLCIGCQQDITSSNPNHIVLVNAGTLGRAEIGNVIKQISECKPKVIAVNFIFREKRTAEEDSVLATAIRASGNTILPVNLIDGELIRSDSIFTNGATNQGALDYGFNKKDEVTGFSTFFAYDDSLFWSFPAIVASYYDLDRMEMMMKEVMSDEYYEISFSNETILEDTVSLSNLKRDCRVIKDKIVILGYLGPGNEDMFLIPSGERQYSVLIISNIINDILEGRFRESDLERPNVLPRKVEDRRHDAIAASSLQ